VLCPHALPGEGERGSLPVLIPPIELLAFLDVRAHCEAHEVLGAEEGRLQEADGDIAGLSIAPIAEEVGHITAAGRHTDDE